MKLSLEIRRGRNRKGDAFRERVGCALQSHYRTLKNGIIRTRFAYVLAEWQWVAHQGRQVFPPEESGTKSEAQTLVEQCSGLWRSSICT